MIRISSQQVFSGGVNRLQDLNVNLNRTQEQISTGKRVNNPSDDPVAAARILKLDQEVGRIETYQRNVGLAENRLKQEESALSSITDLIQRVRELTVQAGNGSLSAEDRQSLSAELKQRLQELASQANTQDSSGSYIFAGFQGDSPAFAKNADGKWLYQGDEGQRKLEVDEGVSVAISDHGKDLFVNVPSAGPTFFTESDPDNAAGSRISVGAVLDPQQVSSFSPTDVVVGIVGSPAQYVIQDRNDVDFSDPSKTLASGPYTSGESIRFQGMQFEITGAQPDDRFTVNTSEKQSVFASIEKLIYGLDNLSKMPQAGTVTSFVPAAGDTLDINGVSFSFAGGETLDELAALINDSTDEALSGVEAVVEGGNLTLLSSTDEVSVTASGTPTWNGTLTITGARFNDIDSTATPPVLAANYLSSQAAYDQLVADSLDNLDNAQEAILRTQTEIGGRLNQLESTGEFLDNAQLYAKDIRSQLQDVDYAEAISNLSFQSFVLQAAQQSFAKTSQLSLFDRL